MPLTATELIAFAALALSAIATYLTYRTGKEAREEARAAAREAREAQAAEARSARLHEARKAVYVDLLDYVLRIDAYVDRNDAVYPEPEPEPSAWPSAEDKRSQGARTAAFGSQPVRSTMTELEDAFSSFRWIAFLHQAERGRQLPLEEEKEARLVVSAKATAVRERVAEVIDLVNNELAQ